MTEKEKNRQQFPEIATVLDLFREVFGDGVKVTYAREGVNEKGIKMELPEQKKASK